MQRTDMHRHLRGFKVQEAGIQPGKLRSEQIDKRWPTEELRREWAKKEVPMERMGEPHELADLAVFLASPRASYITGNIVAFDGGARFFAF